MFTATGNHKRSSPHTACEEFPARRFRLRCSGRSWSLLKVQRRSIFTAFPSGSCRMEIHGKQSPLTQRRFTRRRKRRSAPPPHPPPPGGGRGPPGAGGGVARPTKTPENPENNPGKP